MKSRPPGERGGIELETRPDLISLHEVVLAYLEASRQGIDAIPVYDPEGKHIGTLLPPTSERAHASIRLIEGNRIIPLAQPAVREARYDPKNYRVKAPDAARIRKVVAGMMDERDRERSAASLRSRAEAQAERARDPLVEAREVFGERLKGIAAVLKTFTIREGNLERPLRTCSDAEKLKIADSLRAKLKTPEAKALMRVLKKDPQEATHWVCMLRIARLDHGAPLTFAGIEMVLNEDMRARHQGNLVDAYQDLAGEKFYTDETAQDGFADKKNQFEWALVRFAAVPGTNGVPIEDQDEAIFKFLERKGLDVLIDKTLRRRPVEAIYDYAVCIRSADDLRKDPLFKSPVAEAIEIGDDDHFLGIGPYNPHSRAGVSVEKLDRLEDLPGEMGVVVQF